MLPGVEYDDTVNKITATEKEEIEKEELMRQCVCV